MIRSILLSLFLVACACEIAQAKPPTPAAWERVLKNPVSEAKAALARGDRRLLAVQGYSTTLPGVDDATFMATMDRGDFVIIDDTTDYIETQEQARFKERAEKYAAQYNRYIVEQGAR